MPLLLYNCAIVIVLLCHVVPLLLYNCAIVIVAAAQHHLVSQCSDGWLILIRPDTSNNTIHNTQYNTLVDTDMSNITIHRYTGSTLSPKIIENNTYDTHTKDIHYITFWYLSLIVTIIVACTQKHWYWPVLVLQYTNTDTPWIHTLSKQWPKGNVWTIDDHWYYDHNGDD